MTLQLTPLPNTLPYKQEWSCPQDVRLETWPYVRRCAEPAVGAVPREVADHFQLRMRAVCETHASQLEEAIPKDSNLMRFVLENRHGEQDEKGNKS